jgi:protein phosphatase
MPFVLGEATHPGETGKNNEDSYGYLTVPVSDNRKGNLVVAAVADGIGGKQAGEQASSLAVQAVEDYFAAHPTSVGISHALTQALSNANTAIHKRSHERALYENMGTTATVAVVSDDELYIANVGDSRAYLIGQDGITQLSTDHSWGQEAIEAGQLLPAEARSHPNRNVLKRHLGIDPEVEVDLRMRVPGSEPDDYNAFGRAPLTVQDGDIVLLCTDGLTDLVADHELLAITRKFPPQRAADRLIQLARRRGGHDNITVLAFYLGTLPPPGPSNTTPLIAGSLALVILAAVALFLVAAALRGTGWLPAGAVPDGANTIPSPTHPPGALASGTAAVLTAKAAQPIAAGATDPPAATPATSTVLPGNGTPVPMSTPVPTRTSTPAHETVTATISASQSPQPSGTQSLSVSGVFAPALVSPAENAPVNGRVDFTWQPVAGLPDGAAYEVVWWNSNEDPANARGIAPPTSGTQMAADLDVIYRANQMTANNIYWSVLVVRPQPYSRLTQPNLSDARRLVYQPRSSSSGPGAPSANTPVPP